MPRNCKARHGLWCLGLSCLWAIPLQAQQSCADVRAAYPEASFSRVVFKDDEFTGAKVMASKGADDLSGGVALRAVFLDGAEPTITIEYLRVYLTMGRVGAAPPPVSSTPPVMYVLADSIRRSFENPEGRSELRSGNYVESYTYALTAADLPMFADAKKVRFRVAGQEVSGYKLGTRSIEGAQAILLALSCGLPDGPQGDDAAQSPNPYGAAR